MKMFGAFALKTIGATLKINPNCIFFGKLKFVKHTAISQRLVKKHLEDSAVFYQQIPSVQFETRTQQVLSRWLVS